VCCCTFFQGRRGFYNTRPPLGGNLNNPFWRGLGWGPPEDFLPPVVPYLRFKRIPFGKIGENLKKSF